MTTSFGAWRGVLVPAVLLGLCLPGAIRADEKKDKKKGKAEEKPIVVQIDLSKLPPDLAKQLLKYAESKGKKETEKKTPPAAEKDEKKPTGRTTLPPGLAKKPANHPGVINWLKAHPDVKVEKKPSKKEDEKKAGKKKDKDDDDKDEKKPGKKKDKDDD